MSKFLILLLLAVSTLANARGQDPLDYLIYYEQNYMVLNGGDLERLERDTNLQSIRFRPAPGRRFNVKSYWVDSAKIGGYTGSNLAQYPLVMKQLIKTENGRTYYRLLVHPESEVFYREYLASVGAVQAEDYVGEPGASSRTLRVYPKDHKELSFFAKLSLNRMIGAVRRTIKATEISTSIGINNTLVMDEGTFPSGFNYFPEAFGLMPPGMDRGGMLVRTIPEIVARGETRFMPLFSIYSRNAQHPVSILEKMIGRTGLPADEFMRTRVLRPFLEIWAALAVEHGITMEAHGQNVVIGIGSDGLPDGNFGFRDFGGFNIDYTYRDKLGKPRPELPVVNNFAKDYHQAGHLSNLRGSIESYFTAGVIYDIDKLFADQWRELGYEENHLQEMVRSELNDILQTRGTGISKIYKNFVNLANVVTQAREQYASAMGRDICERRLRGRKATVRASR